MIHTGYTGIETRGGVLWFNPCLPDELGRLRMQIRYRGQNLSIEIATEKLKVTACKGKEKPIKIGYKGEIRELEEGKTLEIELSRDAVNRASKVQRSGGTDKHCLSV